MEGYGNDHIPYGYSTESSNVSPPWALQVTEIIEISSYETLSEPGIQSSSLMPPSYLETKTPAVLVSLLLSLGPWRYIFQPNTHIFSEVCF